MGRLIFLLVAVIAALVILLSAVRSVNIAREASVPKTAKTISYVLLIVLMFGVVTGWLGGL